MPDPLFSSSWYRVAGLRPRLRSNAKIHRHVYRNEAWYVLQDLTNQRFLRFTPATQVVLGMMDGQRSVQELWVQATEALGDEAPTQDDVIRLLAQLHMSDVLQCDVPPDTVEMLERFEKAESRGLVGRFLNPFAIKVPLWDPERFLQAGLPWVGPLVGWPGLLLWLGLVLPAAVLAVGHWEVLSEGFIDRVLTPGNILLIWLIFPLIKALHELGHGFIAKAFGCEVHEMGIMFLVFTPIPYVDASSASSLPDRKQRALVGAGGMIAELFVAACAFYVWLNAEPGAIRTVAYNAMLIAGVTTVVFNGNPLLRFDGYYILADWIEIPNLRTRASGFVRWLFERYALGRRRAQRPHTTRGEPAWLVGYAVSSFVYRIFIMVAIFLFVMSISLPLGVFLVVLSSIGWFVVPAVRTVRALFESGGEDQSRTRAWAVVGGGLATIFLVLCVIPFPHRTQTEGVVWIPEEALVRAQAPGFVERVVATPGAATARGDVLIECVDPDLASEVEVLAARLRLLDAQYDQGIVIDRVQARMIEEERRHVRQRLARAQERLSELTIRSQVEGIFVPVQPEDLPGRFLKQGQPIAHVLQPGGVTVRAVVRQDDIDLVRDATEEAQVRLAEARGVALPARILRFVPAASTRLPSVALGLAGGGDVAIDPRDERGTEAVERHFVVELEVPEGLPGVEVANLGERVHVRFAHPWEPLAVQWARSIRQVFLSRLDV